MDGALTLSETVHLVHWFWGHQRRYRPRSATAYALSGPTWHELQSDLHTAATFVGLGGAQERPSYEPRLTAANAGLGAT